MPAGSTYTPIATTTLGSAAASYTFSSIPSTYTDLVLVINTKTASGSGGVSPALRFNSDSSSNYSETYLRGDGTSATSGRDPNMTKGYIGFVNDTDWCTVISHIQNYANATTYKTVISRSSRSNMTAAVVTLWRKTPEAINTILVDADGSTFVAGSTFTLYGIASA